MSEQLHSCGMIIKSDDGKQKVFPKGLQWRDIPPECFLRPGKEVLYDHPSGIDTVKLLEVHPGYAVIESVGGDEANPEAEKGDPVPVTWHKIFVRAHAIMDDDAMIESHRDNTNWYTPEPDNPAAVIRRRLYEARSLIDSLLAAAKKSRWATPLMESSDKLGEMLRELQEIADSYDRGGFDDESFQPRPDL